MPAGCSLSIWEILTCPTAISGRPCINELIFWATQSVVRRTDSWAAAQLIGETEAFSLQCRGVISRCHHKVQMHSHKRVTISARTEHTPIQLAHRPREWLSQMLLNEAAFFRHRRCPNSK